MISMIANDNYDIALSTVLAHEIFHHAIGNSTFHPYNNGFIDANEGRMGGVLSPEAAKALRKAFGY